MRIISFMGPSSYKRTVYSIEDGANPDKYETNHVQEALLKFFPDARIELLGTTKALNSSNYNELVERIGEGSLTRHQIPAGASEKEISEIFKIIISIPEEGEEIALDITHGFRSQPIIALVACAYLRRVKRNEINYIFYGAYQDGQSETPIINLVPLVNLLDWTTAIEFMQERSDGQLLAQELKRTQNELHRKKKDNGQKDVPYRLQSLAKGLQEWTLAIHNALPIKAAEQSKMLAEELVKAESDILKWAAPFEPVSTKLKNELSSLALEKPEQLDRQNLEAQLNLIERMISNGLYLPATIVAREWVISLLLLIRGQSSEWLEYDVRESFANEINSRLDSDNKTELREEQPNLDISLFESLIPVWSRLRNIRNHFAHAGLRRSNNMSFPAVEKSLCLSVDEMRRLLSVLP